MKDQYVLTVEPRGNLFLYRVIDTQTGKAVGSHISFNGNYVACTRDAEIFFERLDLIGKGDHGKRLEAASYYYFNTSREQYKTYIKQFCYGKSRLEILNFRRICDYETWKTNRQSWAAYRLEDLNTIAYLKKVTL